MLYRVAPLVGAWIEIADYANLLKGYEVAPLVGAWIEISEYQITDRLDKVAPLVGAWIEIYRCLHLYGVVLSLPLWERGLK